MLKISYVPLPSALTFSRSGRRPASCATALSARPPIQASSLRQDDAVLLTSRQPFTCSETIDVTLDIEQASIRSRPRAHRRDRRGVLSPIAWRLTDSLCARLIISCRFFQPALSYRKDAAPTKELSADHRTESSLPTSPNASTARSISEVECAADICVRIRA